MARTHFKRYGRSAFRKGKRLYKYAQSNPQQAMALARSAWQGLQTIRGLVNSEMFHLDSNYALGNQQSAIFNITALGQGDTVSTRTGNSVLAKSITFNGNCYINATQTTNTRIMIALVQDKQQISDTTPAVADIFTSNADPHALLNVNNLGRFKILKRMQITLDPNTAGNNARTIRFFQRLNFHVRYNGTGTGDLQKNGVYLVYMTSEATLYPVVSLNTRLNYHDN